MKTATVTAYLNTGFTGINVPDSPAIIENNYISKSLDVINCLPLSGQVDVSIRVKAYDELHETDYIKMVFSGDNTTYWAKVNGYQYLSSDTVDISLTMDYWLTLGGVSNISSISGMTKRVHVAKADDQLFAFNEPDEMINPANPLKTVKEDWSVGDINADQATKDVVVVMSTLDLYAIGKCAATNYPDRAVTLSDGDPDNPQSVTIPRLFGMGEIDYSSNTLKSNWAVTPEELDTWDSQASVWADYPNGEIVSYIPDPTSEDWSQYEIIELMLPNVGYFDASDEYVQRGISVVHDCGVEDCLLEEYVIPKEYHSLDGRQAVIPYFGRVNLSSKYTNTGYFVCGHDLDYEYGTYSVRNKKVFTGSCNAYTIYAKANCDMETFNPEVLSKDMSGDAPAFRIFTDLRRHGGAMCAPLAINGDVERWYMNFVKEMEFQSAPIKYDTASGSAVTNALTRLSLNTKTANFNQAYPIDGLATSEKEGFIGSLLGSGGSAIAGVLQTAVGAGLTIGTGGLGSVVGAGLMASGIASLVGGGADIAYQGTQGRSNLDINRTARKQAFNAQVFEEKAAQQIRVNYVAPQIKFQQSQTLRELTHNGFIIIKYQMDDADLQRCDKLLTMYGYARSKALEKTDLTNRPSFNYVEAGDVHIETSLPVPKWVREGAEIQFVGLRIWHKAFDTTDYEDNE